jgi:hypothetical protein
LDGNKFIRFFLRFADLAEREEEEKCLGDALAFRGARENALQISPTSNHAPSLSGVIKSG